MERFENLGIIKNDAIFEQALLAEFEKTITQMKTDKSWTKDEIVSLFFKMLPDFGHKETGKYLDGKM